MKTLKVSITENDISNGEKESETSCPIALAVLRVFTSLGEPVDEVHVTADTIKVSFDTFYNELTNDYENKDSEEFELTEEGKKFVKDFDGWDTTVKPFVLELERTTNEE